MILSSFCQRWPADQPARAGNAARLSLTNAPLWDTIWMVDQLVEVSTNAAMVGNQGKAPPDTACGAKVFGDRRRKRADMSARR